MDRMSREHTLFTRILRENGVKVTMQRILVLEALSSCPDGHLTAEEIYNLVKAAYPEIGLATIYRTIQLLWELRLIDRISLDDGFVRYEIREVMENKSKHHHHHLICKQCGKVASFQDDLLEELEEKIQKTMHFTVSDHEVKLYGFCEECRRKI